jgi:hypothetical protein
MSQKRKRARIGRPPKHYPHVKLMLPPATDAALEQLANAMDATKSEFASAAIKAVIKAHRQRGRSRRKASDETVLAYFGLEPEKLEVPEAARERGCTIDELVCEAAALFLEAKKK